MRVGLKHGLTSLVLSAMAFAVAYLSQSLPARAQSTAPAEVIANVGHSWRVSSVALSKDDRILASGGWDRTVKLWDAASGQLLRTFFDQRAPVAAVALSPDGRLVASASDRLRVWETATGRSLFAVEAHKAGTDTIAFAPDGKAIASGGEEGVVKVWDVGTGKLVREFNAHTGKVNAVSYAPSGAVLASAGSDNQIKIWNSADGRLSRALAGHTKPVTSIAFGGNGGRIISGAEDGALAVWNVASGQQVSTFRVEGEHVHAVALSADGRHAISAHQDATLRYWDVATGEIIQTLKGHWGPVTSVVLASSGLEAISGATDATLRRWRLDRSQLLTTIQTGDDSFHVARSSPDGTMVAAAVGDQLLSVSDMHDIRLWDLRTGRSVRDLKGHEGAVGALDFSPDGARLVSGGHDNKVFLWAVGDGRQLRALEGHEDSVLAVRFSERGDRIVSGSADKTVRLWDASSGAQLRTFEGHSDSVGAVAISSDGRWLASGGSGELKLWDAASGALVRDLSGHTGVVVSISFAGSDQLVSIGDDETLRVWSVPEGREVRNIKLQWAPTSLDVAAGARVAAVGEDVGKAVRLFDLDGTRPEREFGGHTGSVRSVSFSRDGSRMISSGEDNTIRLWNVDADPLVRVYGRDGFENTQLAISASGARLVSGGGGSPSTLTVWSLQSGDLVRTLKSRAGYDAIALLPDGESLLAAGDDNVVRRQEIASGRELKAYAGHSGKVQAIAVAKDGSRFASASEDKTLRVWDTATGAVVRTLNWPHGSVTSAAFSADGRTLYVGGAKAAGPATMIQLFRWPLFPANAAPVELAPYAGTIQALSPDGRFVLSAGDAPMLRSTSNGALVHTFKGHLDVVSTAAFSADGLLVLSGSWDGTAKLWDASSGGLVRTFEGHTGRVYGAAFIPGTTRIVTAGGDGTVRVWDQLTGRQIAMMVGGQGENGSWITITRTGFFRGPLSGTELVGIVRGLETTDVGQVHQSLYGPDLVRETMMGDPDGEAARAAEVVDLTRVLDSGPAPKVAIESHAPSTKAGSDVATFVAKIEDKGKGVGRVEWRVNDITVAVAPARPRSPAVTTIRQDLVLDAGENIVEVIAYNATNTLASRPSRRVVRRGISGNVAKPVLHVLAIGINDYVDDGWIPPGGKTRLRFPPLSLAVKDATAIAQAFEKAAAGHYGGVKVVQALDRNASRENLDRIIGRMAGDIHPRDTFILFAAAHGYSVNGRFYLIPQDYKGGSNPAALASKAIGQAQIQQWVANRIKARKALILLDTCEAGALVSGHSRSRVDTPASEAAIGRLHEATGRPVLTAAAEGRPAFEGNQGHGIFTSSVLDALRKADANGNGTIELSELINHVQEQVPRLSAALQGRGLAAVATRGVGGFKQSSRFGSRGEDFVLTRKLP